MDDTVDPCEDFYMFSCGNWLKKNIIPEDKSQYSRFSQLAEEVKGQLKGGFL